MDRKRRENKLDAKEIGKYGLLFYNALFNVVPFYVLCGYTGIITFIYVIKVAVVGLSTTVELFSFLTNYRYLHIINC